MKLVELETAGHDEFDVFKTVAQTSGNIFCSVWDKYILRGNYSGI